MEQLDFAPVDAGLLVHAWKAMDFAHLGKPNSNHAQFGYDNSNSSTSLNPGFFSCVSPDGWGPLSQQYLDIAPCFLQGVLFGASAILMVLVGSYQIYSLRQKKISSNRVDWSFYTKLLLVLVYFVFQVVLWATLFFSHGIVNSALVVNFLAIIVAFGIHYVEQFKSTISSGVLLFYWLFQVLLQLGRVVNLLLRLQVHTNFGVFTILSTVAAILVLVLEINFPPRSKDLESLKLSPYDTANVFSKITFNWMAPLMKKGYVQFLTEKDLPQLPIDLRSTNTSSLFNHHWNTQSKHSLVWALARSFGPSFLMSGVFKSFQDMLSFVQPQLLKKLIKFVNDYYQSLDTDEPLPLTRGLMIAVSMFVVSVVQTACLHQYFRRAFDMGMKIKSSLTSVIYNKSLVVSNEAKQETTTGDVVNLMSVDVQRLQDLLQNLQMVWSGPFQIFLCLYSLHGLIGRSMWAGVFIMLIMIPLNGVLARFQRNLQKIQMKNKDERSRLINEILNNMKSLKLYGWEQAYLKKLTHVRNDKELANLKKIGVFSAFTMFTWTLSPFLVTFSTFAVFVLIEKDRSLSTDIVFPALALFNLLSFPLAVFPNVITSIIESQVAIGRLTKYLCGAELQEDAVTRGPRVTQNGAVAVSIKNGTYLWSKQKGEQNYKVALSNINLEVKKGELDCIVGKVGSGKSSIIQSLLGDLYKLDGEAIVNGKVAYVSQVPWIVNGTVRENVLFGHKYDAEFYDKVLKACALTVDLKILPKGDKTEVGEKGISLSGGQKARLSLARAVYARADVYLLDDPLSAVDEHVGRHLINHVLGPHGLLKSKCKILATNSINVLSIADNMHMVKDGKLVEQGSYADIMKQEKSQLRQLILEFGRKREEKTEQEAQDEEKPDVEVKGDLDSDSDFDIVSLRRASDALLIPEDELEDDEDVSRKEHSEQGKVKWDVYREYAKACRPSHVAVYFVSTLAISALGLVANVFLKYWSEINTRYGYNPNALKYLSIYLVIGIFWAASSMVSSMIMWIYCSIEGSTKLHNDMSLSVFRAPMSFFETTPIGRILNRFSTDIYKVDEILARVFAMFFSNSTKVLFTVLVICFSTWQFILIVIPTGFLYSFYQQYYMKTSRELRRLDSISKSPIFANFQESLNGVSIIRAYGQQDRFKFLNQHRVDKNMRAYNPSVNANRWLAVRLEFLGSIIILSAAGLSILTLKSGHLTPGLVGLSVSYALQITQSLNWIVRMTVEVETNIVSVERILEYSRLTPEAPEVIEDNRPAADWPQAGELRFNDYSARYRPELDLVLKNINLSVKSHEKIGVVGRTGAGKSSLTLALFRIIESSSGNINIDGVNTSSIGLADLRHKLSIIPQDSQVFEGTIRSNIDPTECFTEDQMWRALELSHLKDHVLKMLEEDPEVDNGLDVKIYEGGSNLSVGQRQLMCLARALLIPSHILVLDEATAAVDVETDQVLQKTIREEFADRTILTIAHRLNTILDSDRIVVLDHGEIAEFDSPENLLKKKESLFYALCKEGGFVEK